MQRNIEESTCRSTKKILQFKDSQAHLPLDAYNLGKEMIYPKKLSSVFIDSSQIQVIFKQLASMFCDVRGVENEDKVWKRYKKLIKEERKKPLFEVNKGII